ncbi:MAG: hypothetical protein IT419_08070 [Planctomycetes bacterium]|nr:hypothetical protein [Planctomycetota bacterium]
MKLFSTRPYVSRPGRAVASDQAGQRFTIRRRQLGDQASNCGEPIRSVRAARRFFIRSPISVGPVRVFRRAGASSGASAIRAGRKSFACAT